MCNTTRALPGRIHPLQPICKKIWRKKCWFKIRIIAVLNYNRFKPFLCHFNLYFLIWISYLELGLSFHIFFPKSVKIRKIKCYFQFKRNSLYKINQVSWFTAKNCLKTMICSLSLNPTYWINDPSVQKCSCSSHFELIFSHLGLYF